MAVEPNVVSLNRETEKVEFEDLTEHGFLQSRLGEHHDIYLGRLPLELLPSEQQFEILWNLHPANYPTCRMHGRLVELPRWHEAFGKNYRFSGITRVALPIRDELAPFLDWARQAIDRRLNGMLLNWYDGKLGHYIGRHRDSRSDVIEDTPIVTISFGETRIFRLRKWKGSERIDVVVDDGSVVVMPYATNLAWTHEITESERAKGRRISFTVRAFE